MKVTNYIDHVKRIEILDEDEHVTLAAFCEADVEGGGYNTSDTDVRHKRITKKLFFALELKGSDMKEVFD